MNCRFIRSGWIALLLLAIIPGVVTASEWKRVFNQLPEDIQNRILDESTRAYQQCNTGGVRSVYSDCKCVSEKFREGRVLKGPDERYVVLYDTASKSKDCLQPGSIEVVKKKECLQNNQWLTGKEKYCGCLARSYTKKFMKRPYLTLNFMGMLETEAVMECGLAKYQANTSKIVRENRRKNTKPVKLVVTTNVIIPVSPFPWEWIRVDMSPLDLRTIMIAKGFKPVRFKTRQAIERCLQRSSCSLSYRQVSLGKGVNLKLSVRLGRGKINYIHYTASYPKVLHARVARSLKRSVKGDMLKPVAGLPKVRQSRCTADRTMCINLATGIKQTVGRNGNVREFFRTHLLAREHKSGMDIIVTVEIAPVRGSGLANFVGGLIDRK